MLRGKRVLLEPASKELRFVDGALEPRIELDLANNKSVRIRVVFELNNRRFPLSSGAWFEGTPGWHLDTTEGVARPVSSNVTPAWLQRLYRSPALVQPMTDLPRLLVEYIPRVAASLSTELPDLSQVADVLDATPNFAAARDRRHRRRARHVEGRLRPVRVRRAAGGLSAAARVPAAGARRGAADRGAARRRRRARRGAAADEPRLPGRRGRRGARGQGRRRDQLLDARHRHAARRSGSASSRTISTA